MIDDRVTKPIASGTHTIAVEVIDDRVTKPIASGTCTIAVVVIEDREIASGISVNNVSNAMHSWIYLFLLY